jgi:hypothetical protein
VSAAKHTPGPWANDGYEILDSSRRLVASLEPRFEHDGEDERAEADACLIAAAPEMLVALLALTLDARLVATTSYGVGGKLDDATWREEDPRWFALYEAARAALAKAGAL